jgi:hypothetical protein
VTIGVFWCNADLLPGIGNFLRKGVYGAVVGNIAPAVQVARLAAPHDQSFVVVLNPITDGSAKVRLFGHRIVRGVRDQRAPLAFRPPPERNERIIAAPGEIRR